MKMLHCFSLLYFVVCQAKDPVCQGGACKKGSANYLLQQRQRLNKSTSIAAQHLASQANVSQRARSNIAKASKDQLYTVRTIANRTRGSSIKATANRTHGSSNAKAIDVARARVGRSFRSKEAIKEAKAAGTQVKRKFRSKKAKDRSTGTDDTFILHLVETCDAAASSCTGGLTVYKDTSQSSAIDSASLGGSLNCAQEGQGGIPRRRDGRRRRRRRRDETCTMQSFTVDAGCQMTVSLDNAVSAFYGPGTYNACPCPGGGDDISFADEYLMAVTKHEALCDSAAEEPNLALLYEMGADVSVWGTDCISDYPVVMKDSSTGLYYVLENASDPCYVEPSDAISASTTLTSDDKATCSGFTTGGFDMCLDTAAGVTEYASAILAVIGDESSSTLAVVTDIAIPVVTWLLNSNDASIVNNFNFCLGQWTGSELAGASWTSSLYADNCHYPPYVDTNSYTVMAVQLPVALLNAYSLCTDEDVDGAANFCVAYTDCSSGQPTFAMMIDGTAAGCLFGNSGVTAATAGLSQIVSKAVANLVETVGWGLSLTGEFQKTFTIWKGDFEDVTINGNVFRTLGVDLANMLPEKTQKYLQVSGTFYSILQIGDGSVTQTIRDLYSADTPVDVLESLTSFSQFGSFSISVYFKFDDLTNGLLSDLYLGDSLTINGLATTQTLDGAEPGLYLYAAAGEMNIMSAVMAWFCGSFAGIIDAIGGTNFADTLSDFFAGQSSSSSGKFGIFLNTDSFGFMAEVEATAALFTTFPLAGAMDLGTITIECTMKLMTIGMVCSIGYDQPKWVGAVWEAINGAYQMVVGSVKDTALAAWESAADIVGGIDFIEQWGNFADSASDTYAKARGEILKSSYYQFASNAVTNPEDTVNQAIDSIADDIASAYADVSSSLDDVGSAVTDVFSGRRRRRWFSRRRRRKSIFR